MKQPSEPGAIRQVLNLPVGVAIGATYPIQAFGVLLRYPRLWTCVIFPILINILLGGILYTSLLRPGWQFINQSTASMTPWLAGWIASLPKWAAQLLFWLPASANFLDAVLGWILAIALLITTGLLLVQFGAIFGAPWYGTLAERLEQLRMGELPVAKFSIGRALQDVWRAIAFQLKKLILAATIGILLLLINFLPIPVITTGIASFGGIALASLLVGLDFLDPPLERRRLSFRRKLGIFIRTLPASATFSWVCLVLVSIPLLNLLVVPICVAAGTLFCCDRVLPYLATDKSARS
jgi:CysZ protein